MTVEQRQAATLALAQRGKWLPNESDTGLRLIAPNRGGAWFQVLHADGSRVEVPFKGMAASATDSLQPGAIVPAGADQGGLTLGGPQ
jgi:hypothetical protein